VIGLVEPEAVEAVLPPLRTAVERSFDELPASARRDDAAITEAAKRSLRRVLNERFGKRPLVEIQVMRI
jgi:mRNA degradation ribonuclease J1/J2